MSKKKTIFASQELEKLRKGNFLNDRGYLVSITKKDGTELFEPFMISNFSIDEKCIFITIYDLIYHFNIEEVLDDLMDGFLWFKKKVNITLFRLDSYNNEVYRVIYHNCRLKKYHGKNFSYKNNSQHQWYLEFTYGKKEINTLKSDNSVEIMPYDYEKRTYFPHAQSFEEYDRKVLEQTSNMLNEAMDKVMQTEKISKTQKERSVNNIKKAKKENEVKFKKVYKNPLQNVNLNDIEKNLVAEIKELEDNINE